MKKGVMMKGVRPSIVLYAPVVGTMLVASAWGYISEPAEHLIGKSDARGGHNGNGRTEDSIRRLNAGAVRNGRALHPSNG